MDLETMGKAQLVEGKVDWRGKTALRYKHGGVRASALVLVAFTTEQMANVALAVNLLTYFVGVMHLDVADAANQLTNFMGCCNILAIVVATFADTYIGRFKAAFISACTEFLGLALLAIQAHCSKLHPLPCNFFDPTSHCEKVGGGNAALLFIALYLLAAGSAGIRSTMLAHGADQFDDRDPREARLMSSYFNFVLLAFSIGAAGSLTLLVWIQDHKGWDWGFGTSTIAMFLCVMIFIGGLPLYRLQLMQETNAILEIIQVYVAAIRNRNLQLPEDAAELHEIDINTEAAIKEEFLPHSDTFRFLDKAAIKEPTLRHNRFDSPNRWKLCRVTQVENAKIILGMVPVFSCTIVMTLCLAQLQTFSIQQGQTMDKRVVGSFSIPPATLPIIPVMFLIIITPIYDRIVVPFLRKITGNPTGITHLQRIGVGLVLASLSMAVAAIMEVKRKEVAHQHGMLDANPTVQSLPISLFWLSFQYFIFGIADMFTYVGLLEFFYSEAPKALKSVSTCFLWCSMGLGYFFSTILVKIVNKATRDVTRSGGWLAGNNINRNHLNLFYLLLSILCIVDFFIYLVVARRYKYRYQMPLGPN